MTFYLEKDPMFQKAMMGVKEKHRPIVKMYDPKNPTAESEWKYECSRQEGFDLLYKILVGGRNE